ncbi:hypothetical protein NOK12_22680 [Nocardioides sp. OK12]|uniref:ATP-dependent metallopeptidase FtsH/Yme1/Tma family protein n=1 Tax=Nocardioides sp. OK12 TaxID=2758661 RepID=UPI0021C493F8|nr:AAA family ATPase [Nocardioides sp. OK12]GHJ59750.1 hypothetical protein NOK12_22680 [Nocardioides sp. OK12]
MTKLPVPSPRAWLLLAAAVLLGCFAWGLAWLSPEDRGERVGLDELASLVAEEQVTSAVLLDQDARVEARVADGAEVWSAYPTSDAATARLLEDLVASGARVEVDPQPGRSAGRVVVTTLLPLLVLAAVFGAVVVGGGGGATGEVRRFGTLDRGRRGGRVAPPATGFADVAGVDEAVGELREIVEYLREPERYSTVGAEPPKGVLLFGPPGTGKTLIARATAGEAGVPFFSVAGAEFVESLVGVGAARVRDLFTRVREAAPAIVFIDEIDALGRRRGAGGNEEREQTLNQLLVELDGFTAATGVVVMGATNRPDILDPALVRPGRLDRHVVVEAPDLNGRLAILRVHTARRPLDPGIDLLTLARRTPGLTGADLAGVVNEAALLSVRAGRATIDAASLEEAVERVVSGPRGRGHEATAVERQRLAVHEAGRAVVAHAAGDHVHRVTLAASGPRVTSADAETTCWTLDGVRRRAGVELAGRVAEELVLGSGSSVGENGLTEATRLAREAVTRLGLDPDVGVVRLAGRVADEALDPEATDPVLSERHRRLVEDGVRRLLDEARAEARTVLERHASVLDSLVDELLESESVDEAGLLLLLDGDARPAAPVG